MSSGAFSRLLQQRFFEEGDEQDEKLIKVILNCLKIKNVLQRSVRNIELAEQLIGTIVADAVKERA
jgi:hypothetical protein